MNRGAVSAALVGSVAIGLASASVVAAAETSVLTVAGNTLIVRTPVQQQLQGALCQSPSYSCRPVPYRSSAFGSAPLDEGADNLQAALENQSGPTIVLAYSQGGMIAATWLERYGDQLDRGDDVTFVLLGSPQHGLGGFGPAIGSKSRPATPTDSGYTVVEVSRQYDLESDYPTDHFNLLAVANAFAGYFNVHTDYTQVDLSDPDNLVQQSGGTTYLLVPTAHLPMLQPLRLFGLNTLANSLESWMKPIVDAGYDRSGYVTLAHAWEQGWTLPDMFVPRDIASVTLPTEEAMMLRSEQGDALVSEQHQRGDMKRAPEVQIHDFSASPVSPDEEDGTDGQAAQSVDMTLENVGGTAGYDDELDEIEFGEDGDDEGAAGPGDDAPGSDGDGDGTESGSGSIQSTPPDDGDDAGEDADGDDDAPSESAGAAKDAPGGQADAA